MSVKLISATQPSYDFQSESGAEDAEDVISYCARVSNPGNQDKFDTAGKLLSYCVRKSHWSVFEMADVTFEIKTSRAIGRQILRHRSFCFQEFSTRYASPKAEDFMTVEFRYQDDKNRQNSIEIDETDLVDQTNAIWWEETQQEAIQYAIRRYNEALERGLAKEQARALFPEGLTPSTMYMKGSLRSWVHYCQLRMGNGTQKEHREIAKEIWALLLENFPFLADLKVTEEPMDKIPLKKRSIFRRVMGWVFRRK